MEAKITIRNLTFSYHGQVVLEGVSADFRDGDITAITGPSGQGKSTLLTAINRLADEVPGARVTGDVVLSLKSGKLNVYRDKYYLPDLRRSVGMVFQKPNPLPVSVLANVSLPLRLAGGYAKSEIKDRCEQAIKDASLWDEVKDRLAQSALELSGGQQQRLCIARALVLGPEILMLDEPTSSLDADAAGRIEQLLCRLKSNCTVIVVSHYLEQVNRVADTVYTIKDKQIHSVD